MTCTWLFCVCINELMCSSTLELGNSLKLTQNKRAYEWQTDNLTILGAPFVPGTFNFDDDCVVLLRARNWLVQDIHLHLPSTLHNMSRFSPSAGIITGDCSHRWPQSFCGWLTKVLPTSWIRCRQHFMSKISARSFQGTITRKYLPRICTLCTSPINRPTCEAAYLPAKPNEHSNQLGTGS